MPVRSSSLARPSSLRPLIALVALLATLLVATSATASRGHGDGHAAEAKFDVETDAVYRIEASSEELTELGNLIDVWTFLPLDGVAIAPLNAEQKARLEALGRKLEIDEERTESQLRGVRALQDAERGGGGGIPGFTCFRTVEETFADLEAAAALRQDLSEWRDIGDSWLKTVGQGGFDQRVLVLTNESIAGPKPVFLLMSAMHARELATAEIATRFALHLLNGYGTDPEATWLLDHREIHIVPQQNPDGRKRAETGLFWRKNVNNDFCANSNFRGIDLNRNSTFFWGGPASSGSTCDETYRGPSAASEPETEAIEDYMALVFLDQKGDMADPAPDDAQGVFISIHSFGELVLFPWEGTNNDSPNHAQLRTLGRKFGFQTDYVVCQDCLGTASGTTVDVAYGEYGVAAYTFEVGTDFFQGCAAFESTIYPDNLESMLYAAKVADLPYLKPSGPEAANLTLSVAQVEAGTPVTLQALIDDGLFDSNGFGTEPTQNIAAARAGFDLADLEAGGGTAMAAMDGAFDAVQETVTASVDTTGLTAGSHLLFVVGEDATGQAGPPAAIFLQITEEALFEDDFELGNLSRWSSSVP
ncbi:MAG: M14 family zinc carboxypeptidase [Acidobacteriota bacterium]